MSTNIVKKNRQIVRVMSAGANRGAREKIPAVAAFNAASDEFEIESEFVDPIPGRARQTAEIASGYGVASTWYEGRAEDVLPALARPDVIVAHTDRPGSQRSGLASARASGTPAYAYLIIAQPGAPAFVVMAVVQPGEHRAFDRTDEFFGALEDVTRRSGSAQVFGSQSPWANRLAEPALRQHMDRHFMRNLGHVVAGIEPESAPLEIVRPGQEPTPLVVLPRADTWRSPEALAEATLSELSHPVARGDAFVAAEIVPGAIRLHDFKVRQTDGRLAVGNVPIDGQGAPHATAAERALATAIEHSPTISADFSRTNAVLTSD